MCYVRSVAAVALIFSLILPSVILAEAFKIGGVLCLSGACAEWGTNSVRGATLAAEEITAAGSVLGRPISLVVEDSNEGGAASPALTAFTRIRNDPSIQYLLGPTWSAAGKSLGPIAAKMPIIMTSPTLGMPDFNEAGDNLFNVWPHDDFASEEVAAFLLKQGFRRVGVLSSEDVWERGTAVAFINAFQRGGGQIVADIIPAVAANDIRTEAAKVLAPKPEAIVLSNWRGAAVAARQLRQMGFKGQFATPLLDKEIVKSARGALENDIFAKQVDAGDAFREKYKKRWGEDAGMASDTGYDAVYVYAKAIENAGTFDPTVVKIEIEKLKYNGASGEIIFDGKGGVRRRPVIHTIKGDSWLPLTDEMAKSIVPQSR